MREEQTVTFVPLWCNGTWVWNHCWPSIRCGDGHSIPKRVMYLYPLLTSPKLVGVLILIHLPTFLVLGWFFPLFSRRTRRQAHSLAHQTSNETWVLINCSRACEWILYGIDAVTSPLTTSCNTSDEGEPPKDSVDKVFVASSPFRYTWNPSKLPSSDQRYWAWLHFNHPRAVWNSNHD